MFSSSQTKTTWILSSRQVSTVHAHCLHACACMHMHTHTGATPPPTKRATHTNSDHIQYTAGVSLSDPHKSIKQMEGWMPSIRWLITLQKDKLQRPSKILCHALLYKNPIFKGNSLLLRERGQEREYQLFFDFKVDKIRENSKSIAEQGGGVRLTVKLYVLMYTGSCKTVAYLRVRWKFSLGCETAKTGVSLWWVSFGTGTASFLWLLPQWPLWTNYWNSVWRSYKHFNIYFYVSPSMMLDHSYNRYTYGKAHIHILIHCGFIIWKQLDT